MNSHVMRRAIYGTALNKIVTNINQNVDLPPGYHLIWYDTTDSTNAQALILAREPGVASGTIIAAGSQSQGRGRLGRQWWSGEGNLYYSLILRPGLRFTRASTPQMAAQISLVVAVACCKLLSELVGDDKIIQIKWPNDLLYVNPTTGRAAKIGGILVETGFVQPPKNTDSAESKFQKNIIDFIVIGIGINLVSSPPNPKLYDVTNLAAISDHGHYDLGTIIAKLTELLDSWLIIWQEQGMAAIRAAWMKSAYGLGQEIARVDEATAKAQFAPISGKFLGLDESGGIILQHSNSTKRHYQSGDWRFPNYHFTLTNSSNS
ncbi:MAG: biotin--[acetyl-CoA-carboxylase] ligase [Alphaproteobacteria bacterium]|nr:biotin--[acetyl-CoA-carboxylase] ligase [Alphaproteobacteria bacterium]